MSLRNIQRNIVNRETIRYALRVYNSPFCFTDQIFPPVLRYIFTNYIHIQNPPSKIHMVKTAIEMFNKLHNKGGQLQLQYELADIILPYDQKTGNELLQRIRHLEETYYHKTPAPSRETKEPTITRPARPKSTAQRTVYEDSQNVHNTSINQNVLKIATNLVKKYQDFIQWDTDHIIIDEIIFTLGEKYADQKKKIAKVLRYIKRSNATFGINTTMQDTLKSVWCFIQEHKHQETLEQRLVEEISEMNGMCSTGHLSRFISVIQGFVDDESLILTIDQFDQLTAVIKHYLNKCLQECTDEQVHDSMLDGSDTFKRYIRKCIANKILEWEQEYGQDIIKHIPPIVNKFAQVEIFI